jgi:hypothetical protein
MDYKFVKIGLVKQKISIYLHKIGIKKIWNSILILYWNLEIWCH